jgi:hypothetical protein
MRNHDRSRGVVAQIPTHWNQPPVFVRVDSADFVAIDVSNMARCQLPGALDGMVAYIDPCADAPNPAASFVLKSLDPSYDEVVRGPMIVMADDDDGLDPEQTRALMRPIYSFIRGAGHLAYAVDCLLDGLAKVTDFRGRREQ